VVVVIPAHVGQWQQVEYFLNLVEHGLLSCGKQAAVNLVIYDAGSGYLDRISDAVLGLGKVAIPLKCRGCVELRQATNRNKLPVVFLSPEEEELVLLDRPTNLVARIVVPIDRNRRVVLLRKPVVRVQTFMAMEKSSVAMEFVASTA